MFGLALVFVLRESVLIFSASVDTSKMTILLLALICEFLER